MAESLRYLDFEIEIGIGSGLNYPITARSLAGETHATMLFPFDQVVLENRLLALQNALLRSGRRARGYVSPEEQIVRQFGTALHDALLAGDVGHLYARMLERANNLGAGLRLKLNILDPGLAALPWEFLYNARLDEYPGLSPFTPVVRYLSLPRSVEPLTITPPLRILGMIASPSDLPPLNTEREKLRIEKATEPLQQRGLVELHWVDGQTPQALQRALRGGPWHVLHFIGHGAFDRQLDEGVVMLAYPEGEAQRFAASSLARLLGNHRPLRLVVLNACEGGQGSTRDLFASTAATLAQRGLPAVLAMQYEITDAAAIEFSTTFYDALADGFPVDAAVAEARTAVSIRPDTTLEWGTPVLFMRSPDGVLFHVGPAGTAQPTPVTRIPDAELPIARSARGIQTPPAPAPHPQRMADLMAQLLGAEKLKDWDTVITRGHEMLLLDPNSQAARRQTAAAYRERGVTYYKNGDYDRAIADDTRAIEFDPTNDINYHRRSLSYHAKGDYDRAIADDTRAIELVPNNVFHYQNRSASYHAKGDYDRAIADDTRAIELVPTYAAFYFDRGMSYHAKGDYDQAIADKTRAIELDATNARYYLLRGKSYHAKGDYDQAIADKTRAIELDPTKAAYFYSRGLTYQAKKQSLAARRDFAQAAKMGHVEAQTELRKPLKT